MRPYSQITTTPPNEFDGAYFDLAKEAVELCWQLRGEAEKRHVENATVALQNNLGLGGACVVSVYRN